MIRRSVSWESSESEWGQWAVGTSEREGRRRAARERETRGNKQAAAQALCTLLSVHSALLDAFHQLSVHSALLHAFHKLCDL